VLRSTEVYPSFYDLLEAVQNTGELNGYSGTTCV
jgi:hypothetical protein